MLIDQLLLVLCKDRNVVQGSDSHPKKGFIVKSSFLEAVNPIEGKPLSIFILT